MKIAMEGPEHSSVPFKEIVDVFKEQNKRVELICFTGLISGVGGGGGGFV